MASAREAAAPEFWENLTLEDLWFDGIQFIETVARGSVIRFLPYRERTDGKGTIIRIPLRPMMCSRDTAHASMRQTKEILERRAAPRFEMSSRTDH